MYILKCISTIFLYILYNYLLKSNGVYNDPVNNLMNVMLFINTIIVLILMNEKIKRQLFLLCFVWIFIQMSMCFSIYMNLERYGNNFGTTVIIINLARLIIVFFGTIFLITDDRIGEESTIFFINYLFVIIPLIFEQLILMNYNVFGNSFIVNGYIFPSIFNILYNYMKIILLNLEILFLKIKIIIYDIIIYIFNKV